MGINDNFLERASKCPTKPSITTFLIHKNTNIGIYHLNKSINFSFSGHTKEIAYGVTAGILLIILVILLAFYRNWRYEQELDSLIWKIDFRDIQINEDQRNNSKSTRVSAINDE